MSKTIPRSHKHRVAEIKAKVSDCRVFSHRNQYQGQIADLEWVWDQYLNHNHGKLLDREDGTYRIDVHVSLWYELS